MSINKQVWRGKGGSFFLENPSVEYDSLDNAVYNLEFHDAFGFYLTKISESFVFNYKIYGMETKIVDRFLKTYENTDSGNLGMLLNGTKGTGKTVTTKIVANKLNQPTIIVSKPYKGGEEFLNSIPQNITIFVDEYEKIYRDSNVMLTIMDGAMNSGFRRVFLFTTNQLRIEDNFKQRPSRLRYIHEFSDLAPSIVEEIIDDILVHKEFKEDCIKFISSLKIITVDIVKSVLSEVNIHEESPFEFEDVFNVEKVEGRYKVYTVSESGETELVANHVEIYPRPGRNGYGSEEYEGHWFEIEGKNVGKIQEFVAKDTMILAKEIRNEKGRRIGFGEPFALKIETSYGVHSSYSYSGGYSNYGYGTNANAKKIDDNFRESWKSVVVKDSQTEDSEKETSDTPGLKLEKMPAKIVEKCQK